jgi:hypothetical protein
MPPIHPAVLLAATGVLSVVLLVVLVVGFPVVPAPIPACGSEPRQPAYVGIPASDTRMVTADFGGNLRMTVWSNASAAYALYVQDQAEYSAYAANGSGINGTVHPSPPTSFFWTSGSATTTNNTLLLASGTDWYLLVSNPQSVPLTVNLHTEFCNPP